jgi:hypothetical protein
VAATAALARYRGLCLDDTYLFEGRARQLAGSRFLGRLERLGLYGTNLYDEDLAAILESRGFPRLVALDIGNPREDQNYTLDGLRPIVRSVFAATLEELGIARRYFDAEVVEVIAALPRLHSLDLEGSDLGDDGVAALAGLPHRFTELDLERGHFGRDGAIALAASPILERVVVLDVSSNPIGPDGFVALARAPHLKRLERLELGGLDRDERPGPEFAEALATSQLPASLIALELSLGGLGPRGANALAAAPFERLERLNLYGNMIYDDGAIALVQSPAIRHLRYLDLGNNDLTDVTGIALAESPHAGALEGIELGGALFERSTCAALTRRFGSGVKFQYPWAR